MSPGSHLLASWLLANSAPLAQRERRIVCLAGLSPDLDGAGWLLDRANAWLGTASDYYFEFHHAVGHNLPASLIIAALACSAARRQRALVWALALAAVHVHLLCDLAGSKGPDGYQWPIRYLLPFDDQYQWIWSGQWELHAWQNVAITLAMLGVAILLGWRQRYSFVEVISPWLDREFFRMLARRAKPRRTLRKGTARQD